MAPTSHGRTGPQVHESFANESFSNGAPPPSTLAAQLVENISASTRSTRPDETAELQKLFGIIEMVKNQPELLSSPEERIDHNHMLIYVYARIKLDGLKWDDQFVDKEQLRGEASKAISFLRITIKETPEVLLVSPSSDSFVFRGREPLWLWICPKVLKLLGHSQCLAITTAIETFFHELFQIIGENGSLWLLIPQFLLYLRSNFNAICENLEKSKCAVSGKDSALDLRLPVESYLTSIKAEDLAVVQQRCTYTLSTVPHALRQASAIASILTFPFTLWDTIHEMYDSSLEYLPWLMDSYLKLHKIETRCKGSSRSCLPALVQNTLRLRTALQGLTDHDVDTSLRQKACSLLVILCVEWSEHADELLIPDVDDDGDNVESSLQLLSSTLVTIAEECLQNKPISRLVISQLIPALEKLSMQGNVLVVGNDLWRCLELLQQAAVDPRTVSPDNVISAEQFTNEQLRRQVKALEITPIPDTIPASSSKRRKVSAEPKTLRRVSEALYRLLDSEYTGDLGDLGERFKNAFPSLDDNKKCSAIELLGYICCAADDTLIVDSWGNVDILKIRCTFCCISNEGRHSGKCLDTVAKSTALAFFSHLVEMPSLAESRRPRLMAMATLRRMSKHCNDPTFLDIMTSPAAKWCLQSLKSQFRELRIAAGRTITGFLSNSMLASLESRVFKTNCDTIFQLLFSDGGQNLPHLTETCILTWAQVGRAVTDDRLGVVLVKLVEYLGHEGVIAPASAFNEILNLARYRRVSPQQLLEPYWKYLAFSAIKDFASQPKTARSLAELLGVSVDDLLLSIQSYALPFLVLRRNRDVIQKIAEARHEKHLWQPCMDPDNLPLILAHLLIQDSPDVQSDSMELLKHISPHFDDLNLLDLLCTNPMSICLELLKLVGDAEESRQPHIRNGLHLLASMMQSVNGQINPKKSDVTGRFLQEHVLGMMARLLDVFNFALSLRSTIDEQKRCIKAMEEMIRIGKKYIRIARPQLSACILSALEHDELRTPAFSCWAAMLCHLEEEDVSILIETTFFIINQYWSCFDDTSQQKSRDLLLFLLDKEKQLKNKSPPRSILEDVINKLPSFSDISSLSDVEAKLAEIRIPVDNRTALGLLAERISHENSGIVLQALRELTVYLQRQQAYLQASAVSEQPDSVVPDLLRALLDCSSRYATEQGEISRLCTQSIGLVGCLDPNRVETVRSEKTVIVLHNFESSTETTDFALFLLENVMVKSFLSATDTKLQGFLSFAMQKLLDNCDIGTAVQHASDRANDRVVDEVYRKWLALSDTTQEVLTPFLTSKYRLEPLDPQPIKYPAFYPGRSYGAWMRSITRELLRIPRTGFATLIFEPLLRVIRLKDLSIAEFLFPYLVLHHMISEQSTTEYRTNVLRELHSVLQHELPENATFAEREDKKLYYEAVFRVLDYAMRWLQLKRARSPTPRDIAAMQRVQIILDTIPAELISQRAVDCKAFSRALFHLEQHIRQVDEERGSKSERERLLQRLQDIYTQIDEPDGLEGISAHLQVLDINQQILSHRKAGRWTSAQTWYEIKLAEEPDNVDYQIDLLTCLKESGQHDVLLNYVEGIEKHTAVSTVNRIVPYAVEASWATSRWETMEKFILKYQGDRTENFNVSIAQALLHLSRNRTKSFTEEINILRDRVGSSMSYTATSSLQSCHEAMLKCHVLTDLELIAGIHEEGIQHPQEIMKSLSRRLEVLGSYVNDKQYVLGIRRAAMDIMQSRFTKLDISSLWLSSARLARKANSMHQAFNAVLHASQLGDESATIENARLLWKEGHNRKAIQTLQGAIASKVFLNRSFAAEGDPAEMNLEMQQNLTTARAQLLLAKWLDNSGQTHAGALRQQYGVVPKTYYAWEKGHYYLGRHYKKVLDSEKALKPDDQSDEYLTGEMAKLVAENYLRSLSHGTKYLYQTLPRILTLWLELGAQVDKAPVGKVSISKELLHRRTVQLESLHKYLDKYIHRLPAYIFYTALPQIVARIAHPNVDAFHRLEKIIVKVVESYPRQALWSLFAIMTSRQVTSDRKTRGQQILGKLRKGDGGLAHLLRSGEKLANQLLLACNNGDFQSNRTTVASITRDLNFNHKCTPCGLVVPIETCLTATLPTLTDNVKNHKAFSRDVITIDSFLDEVLVLGSLAKPRKLTARGSNGQNYGLLIKPKDDLRTDQRLMEFNSMINRSLKRDAESSRRQLYIKTYAVTPLNEECGIIQWVDGLKTLRDILLVIYRSRGIQPNYGQLAQMMKDAQIGTKNIKLFTQDILGMFPAVLHHWFISQFPNPSTWFAARLKYTRSCAVMSMVGTILGLGDRHGENVLLEEGNGGVFHVDFNCLFDKGLTFQQPERVPFRLTHNMVSAMGVYGYEGPFRQCSELTLSILRQQEETLMTILEAFIYDPTLDLQRDKKRKNEAVRLNPHSVVESIKRKVQGLLPDESIPLSVEGQVEELIKQAVNPRNLTAMYIGWCSFL